MQQELKKALTPDEDQQMCKFYQTHRGGSGAVIIVEVYDRKEETSSVAVFSSIEKSQTYLERWANDDNIYSLTIPYLVDEPDWGNGRVN